MEEKRNRPNADGLPADLDLQRLEEVLLSSRLDTSSSPTDTPRFKLVRKSAGSSIRPSRDPWS